MWFIRNLSLESSHFDSSFEPLVITINTVDSTVIVEYRSIANWMIWFKNWVSTAPLDKQGEKFIKIHTVLITNRLTGLDGKQIVQTIRIEKIQWNVTQKNKERLLTSSHKGQKNGQL